MDLADKLDDLKDIWNSIRDLAERATLISQKLDCEINKLSKIQISPAVKDTERVLRGKLTYNYVQDESPIFKNSEDKRRSGLLIDLDGMPLESYLPQNKQQVEITITQKGV